MGSTESNGHTQENEDYDHTRQHIEQKEVRSVLEFFVFEHLTDKAERTESQLIGGHRETVKKAFPKHEAKFAKIEKRMEAAQKKLGWTIPRKEERTKNMEEHMRRDTQIKRVIPEKLPTISEPKKVTKKSVGRTPAVNYTATRECQPTLTGQTEM